MPYACVPTVVLVAKVIPFEIHDRLPHSFGRLYEIAKIKCI